MLVPAAEAAAACHRGGVTAQIRRVTDPEDAASADLEISPDELEGLKVSPMPGFARGRLRGELVAVKVLRPERAEVEAVLQEMRTLCGFRHPNILGVLGVCCAQTSKAKPWSCLLCLEYCRGGSLHSLLHSCWREPFFWPQRAKVLCDVAAAGDYLHSLDPPVIHGNIASASVLLLAPLLRADAEPHAKLADPMVLPAGRWSGPEVLRGGAFDEKADVFSFAMVIYEVMSRQLPFERLAAAKIRHRILQGMRPDTWEGARFPRSAPPGLAIVMRCAWRQEAAKRPSFEALQRDLLEIELGMPERLRRADPELGDLL